jgi:hypothetical protein
MSPMQPAPNDVCTLCRVSSAKAHADDIFRTVFCPHCGVYAVTETAEPFVASMPPELLVALARAARHAQREGQTLTIGMQNIARLVAEFL